MVVKNKLLDIDLIHVPLADYSSKFILKDYYSV